MKRFFMLTAILCLGASAALAQTFEKGSSVINAGVGFGTSIYRGSGYTGKIPPVSLSYEYCVKDNLFDEKSAIGVGGLLGYTGAKWRWAGDDYGWRYSNFIIGARGLFHYEFVRRLDTYASLMLGYNVASTKAYGDWGGMDSSLYRASAGGFSFGFTLGARYYFSNMFAAFLEAGYDIAYLKIGVSLKL